MKKKVYLFEICIFLLVLITELFRIKVFANYRYLSVVTGIIEMFVYIALIYIIIQKRYSVKQLLIFLVLGFILLIGYIESGKAAYFRGLLLILAAKDIPYQRILKTIFMAMASTFVISVLIYVLKVSPELVYEMNSIGLGYGNPNQSAQVVTILYLLYFGWTGYDGDRKFTIKSILLGTVVYIFTTSRTAVAIIVLVPFLSRFMKFFVNRFYMSSWAKGLVEYVQTIIAVFTYATAYLFASNFIVQTIDLFFTNRIFLNWYALDNNPITLFGQDIELRVQGVYNEVRDIYNITTTVDSTYMLSLLVLGLIPTIIFLAGYVIAMDRAWRRKEYIVITCGLLLTLYGFSESQLTEVYIYFVYFYIMAKSEPIENHSIEVKEKRKET